MRFWCGTITPAVDPLNDSSGCGRFIARAKASLSFADFGWSGPRRFDPANTPYRSISKEEGNMTKFFTTIGAFFQKHWKGILIVVSVAIAALLVILRIKDGIPSDVGKFVIDPKDPNKIDVINPTTGTAEGVKLPPGISGAEVKVVSNPVQVISTPVEVITKETISETPATGPVLAGGSAADYLAANNPAFKPPT
jgi:hypothetical protein